MKNSYKICMGILLASLIAANVSTAINDVWMLDNDIQIMSAPESTNLMAMAQKGSKKRSLRNSSLKSQIEENHSVSLSSTPQPQQSSQWITAKNSNCKVLVDGSVTNPSCTWTGGSVDGLANGIGELVIYSSLKEIGRFKGDMVNGKPHGFGIYTEEKGNTYEGQFKEGVREGKGIYTISSPNLNSSNILFHTESTFIGKFSNNQPVLAKYEDSLGIYRGEFSQWTMNGIGSFRNPDISYEGEFSNNQIQGTGVSTQIKNGKRYDYEGTFRKGKPNSLSLGFQSLLGKKSTNVTNSKAREIAEKAHQKSNQANEVIFETEDMLKAERIRITRFFAYNEKVDKAQNGDLDAQGELADTFEFGKDGYEKDRAKSAKWYRLAANQGHARSQYNLAIKMLYGIGVEKDRLEAINWLRTSANQDYPNAAFQLGNLYEENYNQSEDRSDFVEAKWWYTKSVELKKEGAKERLEYLQDLEFKQFLEKQKPPTRLWLSKAKNEYTIANREDKYLMLFRLLGIYDYYPEFFEEQQANVLKNIKFVSQKHKLRNPNWDGKQHGHLDRVVMAGLANTIAMGDQSYKKEIDEFVGTVYEGEMILLKEKCIWYKNKRANVVCAYTIDDPKPLLEYLLNPTNDEQPPYEDITILGMAVPDLRHIENTRSLENISIVDSDSRREGVKIPVTLLDIASTAWVTANIIYSNEKSRRFISKFAPPSNQTTMPQGVKITQLKYIENNPMKLFGVNGGTEYKVEFPSGKIGYIFEKEGIFDNHWQFWKGSENTLSPPSSRPTKEQAINALYEILH